MKFIPLTRGQCAIVDDEDFEALSKHTWHYDNGYARRDIQENGVVQLVYMHRVLAKPSAGQFVDHINLHRCDNRKQNLRVCTKADNNRHVARRRDNASGYKGVDFNKQSRKWRANIRYNGRKQYIGAFDSAVEAAVAYRRRAKELFGKYAYSEEVTIR